MKVLIALALIILALTLGFLLEPAITFIVVLLAIKLLFPCLIIYFCILFVLEARKWGR